MATTYPLPTLACTVTATGISSPTYADIYASLQASFQSIYGVDSVITPDSQDGQLLAIVARGQADANAATVAVYNSYSPATAQGVALSNAVKINGIARQASSFSSVALLLVGQVGSTINNGVVSDLNNNRWILPAVVVIPMTGSVTVSATCQTPGAVGAPINTVQQIMTPSLGWQSVTNLSSASPGAPVETDAQLRQRQAISTALPSLTVLQGISGAIADLAGVTEVRAFENDTGAVDANGLPAHSIAMVVEGGDVNEIAMAIYDKKTPGAYTYGTTSAAINDSYGIPHTIRFFIPAQVPVKASIMVHALTGYSSAIGDQIKQAVADYINALPIGQPVYISRLYLPAQLYGGLGSESFELTQIQISVYPAAVGSSDLILAFNEIAACDLTHISIGVV